MTFSPNSQQSSQVLGIRTPLLQLHSLHLGMVLHRMHIGQDSPSSDDKPTATRAVLPLPLPHQQEIWLRVNAKHLRHRVHRRHHLHHHLRNTNRVRRRSSYRCCYCIGHRRVGEVAVLVSMPWAAVFGWSISISQLGDPMITISYIYIYFFFWQVNKFIKSKRKYNRATQPDSRQETSQLQTADPATCCPGASEF